MTWNSLKGIIVWSMSSYVSRRSSIMRSGKYMSGDHYQDGYIAMLYETLQDLSSADELYPFSTHDVRRLIFAYNRLSGEKVIDVWKD